MAIEVSGRIQAAKLHNWIREKVKELSNEAAAYEGADSVTACINSELDLLHDLEMFIKEHTE